MWQTPRLGLLLFSHSIVSDSVTTWTTARQASLSFIISWRLHKLMSIELMMSSNHLILCHSLLFLPSIFPSFRVFSNESVIRIRWPMYCSFSFSINPSETIQDWFPLGWTGWVSAVQGILKSLLQHHSTKVSIISAQLYGPTLTSTRDYWTNDSFG